jgi:ribonuclease R
VSALPGDYYHFDQAKQRLVGERTRQVFQLGGVVAVKVARVDLDDRKIDLELADGASPKRAAGAGSRKQGKGDNKAPASGEGSKKARRKTSSENSSTSASSKANANNAKSNKTKANKNKSSKAKSGKASSGPAKVKDGGAAKKPKSRKKTGKLAAAKSSKRASSSRKER